MTDIYITLFISVKTKTTKSDSILNKIEMRIKIRKYLFFFFFDIRIYLDILEYENKSAYLHK